MRIYLFFICNLLFCFASNAQTWHTAADSAFTQALSEEKPLIMVFQGSDWCAPCMKLDREVWSTEQFQDYAAEHFVLLKVDFPRRKKNLHTKEQSKANGVLAEKYNPRGVFPLVVVLDSEGNVKGESGYKRMVPLDYIAELNALL